MDFSPEILRAAQQIELRARKRLTSLLAGNYQSLFRGSGMQFKEFRQYEPGDDIRHISWTTTAKTGKPTIKTYEEDRELQILLLVDVSGSSLIGGEQRRLEGYAELCALLGLSATQAGDKIGCLLFDNKAHHYSPCRRGTAHLFSILMQILAATPSLHRSDLRPALDYCRKVIKQHCLILILSDFMLPNFETELRAVTQKHEVILMRCLADTESEKSISGLLECWDPESGEHFVIDGNLAKKQNLTAHISHEMETQLRDLGQKSGAEFVSLAFNEDYFTSLIHFFSGRHSRNDRGR